ncbi:hypothetical protein [Candidatus Mancarchaeum acidiphilum]|uniref:hypothetical protein n=1 Tax=Candidatus Mancarchaeum acidiphilum TaxID=1920749 RepID=UPI000B58788C|nr:hypothetical protein [Candidatus Mancarchaeum acidiphilum]
METKDKKEFYEPKSNFVKMVIKESSLSNNSDRKKAEDLLLLERFVSEGPNSFQSALYKKALENSYSNEYNEILKELKPEEYKRIQEEKAMQRIENEESKKAYQKEKSEKEKRYKEWWLRQGGNE